jgi:high-affinity iron transporter
MAKNLFSVPIFFVVFREALEAAIIVSVLIGLVKQVVSDLSPVPSSIDTESGSEKSPSDTTPVDDALWRKRLLRRLNLQV